MDVMEVQRLIAAARTDGGATVSVSRATGRYICGGVRTVVAGRHAAPESVAAGLVTRRHVDTIGSWLDSETGRVYLDAGTRHATRAVALRVARVRGELAIWDEQLMREIRVQS